MQQFRFYALIDFDQAKESSEKVYTKKYVKQPLCFKSSEEVFF